MSAELRVDPLYGARVVISEARARRPEEWPPAVAQPTRPIDCPFCPGREALTPPETAAGRPPGSAPDGPGWTWRIVPNRYPAFEDRAVRGRGVRPARGRHEVFVETPAHRGRLTDLDAPAMAERWRAVRDRARVLSARPARLVLLFRNGGPGAGASLSHPHSQLAATAHLPPRQAARIRRERVRRSSCLLCDVVRAEERAGSRTIREQDGFLLFCPVAPRFPGEVWIVPRHGDGCLASWSDERIERFVVVLLDLLADVDAVFGRPDTNLTAPLFVRRGPGHWPVEVVPRLSRLGGFELLTGEFLNGLPPERCADRLRAARSSAPQRPGR